MDAAVVPYADSAIVPALHVEEMKSSRGNPMFRVNNFVFEVDKRCETKFFCRCIRRKSDKCPARVVVVKAPEPVVMKLDKEHTHGEEHRDRIRRTLRQNMKEAAISQPNKTSREVYNEVLVETVRELQPSHHPEELGRALPGFSGVSSLIQRARAKERPPSKATISELTIEGEWVETSDGGEFLPYDDGPDNRKLRFSAEELALMQAEETKSVRGNPLFRVNDYLYEVDKRKDNKFFCRCIRKKADNCSARAIIVKDPEPKLLRLDRIHNHEEERRDRILRTVKQNMMKAALSRPDKTCKEVYEEVLAETIKELKSTPDLVEIIAELPSFDGVRSSMQRSRAGGRPPSPNALAKLNLEGKWTTTSDGDDFLLFNDGSNYRILGFSTDECVRIVCGAASIYMDSTSRPVPKPFEQLYTLHTFYRGQLMPFAFFLLPDKNKGTYVRMLSLLKKYAQTAGLCFRPRKIHLDFEVAAIRAVAESFPEAELKGCNYHFCHMVWKDAQNLGLATFNGDPVVVRFLRSVMALSFVPIEHLNDAWLYVVNNSPGEEHGAYKILNLFREYFRSTWLENDLIFPRGFWNHYRVFGSRTTNHIEDWHGVFMQGLHETQVSIFDTVTHLRKEEQRLKMARVLLDMGLPTPSMRETYITFSELLPRLVDQFESGEISLEAYVMRIADNLPQSCVLDQLSSE